MSLPPLPDAPQRLDHHFEHSYFQLNNISTGNLAMWDSNHEVEVALPARQLARPELRAKK
jgi:hypothetical protein